jgi:AcrR family transcriptional regulator
MTKRGATLSTSDARRYAVVDAAVAEFARTGFHSTPISAVATRAAISPAYVFKLFPGKVSLFVAALDRCYEQVVHALSNGAARADGAGPDKILYEMGGAYAELIADRNLLMLQVHAQSAADTPEIADAVRRGLEKVTEFVRSRRARRTTRSSGSSPTASCATSSRPSTSTPTAATGRPSFPPASATPARTEPPSPPGEFFTTQE